MKRREFMTLIGGAAARPNGARARQGGKLPTIGLLGPTRAGRCAEIVASPPRWDAGVR